VPVDLVAQREQAGRFGQCVELLDGQASGGELVYRVFGVQALEGAPVGRVEPAPSRSRNGSGVSGSDSDR
jgi:hypothetical protein